MCPTLCDTMDCRTPGFPVLHHLLEFAQTHVRWVSDAIQLTHPVKPFSSHLQSFPESGYFPMSQFFTSSGQSIGASTSASVLPMNIQDWFPLGFTGLISLLSKELSRIFSNTIIQKHQSLMLNLFYGLNPRMTIGKTIAVTRLTFVGKVTSLLFNMLSRFVIAFLPRGKWLVPTRPEFLSAQFSRSVGSYSLQPHGTQHARPPCPLPTPRVYSNSCPLSRWCHPTILSSVIPFSSCLQAFPASGSLTSEPALCIRRPKY